MAPERPSRDGYGDVVDGGVAGGFVDGAAEQDGLGLPMGGGSGAGRERERRRQAWMAEDADIWEGQIRQVPSQIGS